MPKTILLADDSITIQKVVELTFSDGDYEVTAVNNGAKAIQKLSEMRPDIILSDIIMPEKNGYEVCEFVKSHPEYRTIPVVLLTGTFEPFDPDRADKAGCDAVVTKPFESQSLIHKVEELIEQARSSAPAAAAPQAAAPETATTAPSPAQPEPSPWADEPPRPSDIFAAPQATAKPTTEMPFASAGLPPDVETRGFPKDTFTPSAPAGTTQSFPPPAPASSPWGEEPATPAGETRALPKMTFEEMQRLAASGTPSEPEPVDESPFGAPPPAESFSGETRAFPKLNLDDVPKPAPEPATSSRPTEELPWGGEAPAGETRAFPQLSFDQLSRAASEGGAAPDLDEPEEKESEEPAWAAPSAPAAAPAPADAAPAAGNGIDLTDDQVDRIARRVVQLMSDQVVRNIAWEVIPDMAEMVVKERIRELESEG
jgi:CheY-like chemotaxis protein